MAALHLLSPRGFVAGATHAGIKRRNVPDVGLLVCQHAASAAAVFTTNKVFAAPIKIGREHIAGGRLRGVVVNSGNANACTGRQGEIDALAMCSIAAQVVDCDERLILPSSTGVIGHLMPMAKVETGIRAAGADLGDSAEHAERFADSILTTDLTRKAAAATIKIGRQVVTLAGVCKGSGMIGPHMALPGKTASPLHATMLAYLCTDADIAPAALRQALALATDSSFNCVTIDNHTSTNDTAVVLASGLSGAKINTAPALKKFTAAMVELCQSLAQQIARDGEGATKLVTVTVKGAVNPADAQAMARAIADSPLVKCAMHGNDPNWGRIVSAAGMCGARFNPDQATLTLQGTRVFHRGRPLAFDTAHVSTNLAAKEVTVELACNLGKAHATVWTCDLSRDYIRINADYHT